ALDCSHRRCPPLGRGYRSARSPFEIERRTETGSTHSVFFSVAEKRPCCFTCKPPEGCGCRPPDRQQHVRTNAPALPESFRRKNVRLTFERDACAWRPNEDVRMACPIHDVIQQKTRQQNLTAGRRILFRTR